jgi:predicted TIM-barrel fold metal-dependent hydrolase
LSVALRQHFVTLVAILAAMAQPGSAVVVANDVADIPIVDTHVHLWDLERPAGIYWISKDDAVLYRSFLPKTHEPIARANNVRAVVVVQAGQSLPDNQWNLDITAHNTRLYRGVVGNLSEVIGTDRFRPLFDTLCKDERYVGYRLSGKYLDGLSDAVFRDLEYTAQAGRTVDFLVGTYTLDDVAEIAQRVPNLRIMLDHFGNVRLDNEPLDPEWVKKLRRVAEFKNVYCKVSAFYGRVKQRPAPSDIRFYQPILDLVVDCFGEDRLVYGSDWPVTRATGDYASVVKLTKSYFDAKGRTASEKLFNRNAVEFYGIETPAASSQLKVHGIFRSNMVLQRDKPITIWGWATNGTGVKVTFGNRTAASKAAGVKGRWEVTFEPQRASTRPQTITVEAGEDLISMDNILVGDVWVMNGQSNMAFALKGVYQSAFESSMAHLPLMRHIRINSGAESEHLETELKDRFINGQDEDKDWKVVTPEVALNMGAIGYVFGSRLQRALQIPIGIIDNARGGASLESLVPRHKFAEHPQAAEYLAWVDQRNAEFSEEAFMQAQMEKWKVAEANYQKAIEEDRKKGVKRNHRRPTRPDGSIRTWSVPGRSPSDAASCYNGMFGVFKGLNIKGVAFHQGFNNAMMNTSCKPVFYRILMKLMVEGWREDFNDAHLPVAIIGLCAGGQAQTRLNFEQQGLSTAAYIRESQRLGLADVNDSEHTAFIPAYDQRIPQLHTKKKKELGLRTARWALKTVYGFEDIVWDTAKVISTVREDDGLLLTFDRPVRADDFGSEIEGFSIADISGVFYMASGVARQVKDKELQNRQIFVSSPLVTEPANVRYGWTRAPMGNLKVDGIPWQPLHSFRTDDIPFSAEVAHNDPDGPKKNSEAIRAMKSAAASALKARLETSE